MATPLLSTYSGGENRVTASPLAVFERIGLAMWKELLRGTTASGPELTVVTFSNQEVGDGSVPDAVIAGNFRWVLETKTERGAYAREGHSHNQLRSHSKELPGAQETRLFVLTPDAERPAWFDQLDGIDPAVTERILWLSFAQLEQSIQEVVDSPRRVVPEQARVLLHELISVYESAGLLPKTTRSPWRRTLLTLSNSVLLPDPDDAPLSRTAATYADAIRRRRRATGLWGRGSNPAWRLLDGSALDSCDPDRHWRGHGRDRRHCRRMRRLQDDEGASRGSERPGCV